MSEGTPLHGDRAAYNATDFQSEHANDIDDATGVHHTLGTGANQAAAGNHVHKDEYIFTMEGNVSVVDNPLRIYNASGGTRTISKVFLAVNTAPTGAAIIVDIHKNGTTIFTTQSNRPQIAADANTGYTTTIEVSTWADGAYLTMHIDQIGSTTPGSDLTVIILYS